MNDIYSAIFTLLGAMSVVVLVFVVRWANDATVTGWRLRRWEERAVNHKDREWKEWFAWRPVKTVAGETIWWTTVYRQLGNTYSDQEDFNWYYYGTIMDVLKDGHRT
jgi:hypothetical protein